jgi:TRAP-type transport system small permease protein
MNDVGEGAAQAVSSPRRLVLAAAAGLDRLIAGCCRLVILLTGIALTLILAGNVAARYVFASGGLDSAQELPERLFPWFIAAGIVLAAQSGGHMAVEWLTGMLRGAGRRALLVTVNALVVAAYLILFQQALLVADIAAIERSPVLRLPNSHGYWAIASCCLGLAIATACSSVRIALIGPDAAYLRRVSAGSQ